MLKLENVSKKFKNFELKDVSFKLEPGYIMGFIGPNGAGKSTTIKLDLCQYLRHKKPNFNLL